MRLPQGWEWLIIAAIIILLFGAKRLPDAARGVGRSLRIFKAETKGLTEDSASPKAEELPAAPDHTVRDQATPDQATPNLASPAPKDVPAPERTEG